MADRKSLWLAMICTCVLAAGAPAAVVISDAFAGHADGASLKGTLTDVGDATWNSGSSSGSGFTFKTGDFAQGAGTKVNWVPYSPATGDIVAVSLTVNLPASGKVVYGFDSANANPIYPNQGTAYNNLLYMEVAQTGAWTLKYRNASGSQGQSGVGSGNVGALTTGTFYAMALQWDPANLKANAWINETHVVTDKIISNINTSPVAFAGFGNNGTNGLQIDDFALSVVPEPGTLILLFSGAGLAMLRRRS